MKRDLYIDSHSKNKYFKTACLLVLLIITPLLGAKAQTGLINNSSIPPPPPDTWSFMKYGNTPTNLYTGTANIEIPIYHYKDADFDIPISVSYSSNGFVPNISTGSVGTGWFLNAGGMITREIKGVADEYYYSHFRRDDKDGNPNNMNREDILQYTPYKHYPLSLTQGYYEFQKRWKELNSNKEKQKELEEFRVAYVFSDTPTVLHSINEYYELQGQKYWQVEYYESTPDIFTFNFMGYKGKFHMDKGNIVVYDTNFPKGEFKINLDALRGNKSTIMISTGDGLRFTFQGIDLENLKHDVWGAFYDGNSRNDEKLTYESYTNNQYTQWDLIRIDAPNGRWVTFSYSPLKKIERLRPGNGYYKNRFSVEDKGKPTKRPLWQYILFPLLLVGDLIVDVEYQEPGSALSLGVVDDRVCYLYSSKVRQLEKISVGNGYELDIDFDYDLNPIVDLGVRVKGRTHLLKDDVSNYESPGKLKSIKVINKFELENEIIKEAVFEYKSFGYGEVKKLFLTSLDISGEGRYSMEYKDCNADPLSSGRFALNGIANIDYWGYYNGERLWIDRVTVGGIEYKAKQELDNAGRFPNYEYSSIGMLKKLHYPTGGFTEFEYEPHDADLFLAHDTDNNPRPTLREYYLGGDPELKMVGGVRISKISDFKTPESSDAIVRKFEYKTQKGKSSGILLNFPIYNIGFKVINGKQWYEQETYSPYDLFAYTFDNTHVGYSRVLEKHNDGSVIEYNYVDYLQIPDQVDPDIMAKGPWRFEKPSNMGEFFINPVSYGANRGKLNSKIMYDNSMQKVAGEYHIYDTSVRLDSTIYCTTNWEGAYKTKYLVGEYPLRKTISSTYFGTDSISVIKEYDYNLFEQIRSVKDYNSNGDITTNYSYYNYELGGDAGYEMYYKKNMVVFPSLTLSTIRKKDSAAEIVTDEIIYNYEKFEMYVGGVLKSIYKTNSIESAKVPQNRGETTDYYTVVSYDHYDSLGNPLQITDTSGKKTTIIWGYKGLYPICIIDNMELSEVRNILSPNSSLIFNTPLSGAMSQNDLNKLKLIPNISITSFKYKPFTGVTQITDPSGQSTYYEYNKHGKLKSVKDVKGNIINSYEYSTDSH